MAASASHTLGQYIGNLLEKAVGPILKDIADEKGFYFDSIGTIRTARKGTKVTWIDINGSKHDLDFVIEHNGTDRVIGQPVAFIESAWRRYTKHSKNKAQEIQGAILPIVEKYNNTSIFLGAILAGEFTAPSIQQLKSCGFEVLYIEYKIIVDAFNSIGIDISFGENTPENELILKVEQVRSLDDQQSSEVIDYLLAAKQNEIKVFTDALIVKLNRTIKLIIIHPLYGREHFFNDLISAEYFIQNLPDIDTTAPLTKIFILVQLENGDEIKGEFGSPDTTIDFLKRIC